MDFNVDAVFNIYIDQIIRFTDNKRINTCYANDYIDPLLHSQ